MSAAGSGQVDPRHGALLGAVCRLRLGGGVLCSGEPSCGAGCRR